MSYRRKFNKKIIFMLMFFIFFCISSFCISFQVLAQDMRQDNVELAQQKQQIREKAEQELKAARKEALERGKHIREDQGSLLAVIAQLKQENQTIEKENAQISTNIEQMQKQEGELREELSETMAVNRELSGFIRSNAKDLETMLIQSFQTALAPDRMNFLLPLINQEKFPSMDDIHMMADILFNEIKTSGEVKIIQGMIVDRQGKEQEADLLILGNFTGIYTLDKETGFLLYSDQSRRFFALSRLPDTGVSTKISSYLQGKSDDVPMDISRGGALRQMTHQLSLLKQIPKGGPIVWPILAILGLAVLIIIERILFLLRKHMNADVFMARLESLISKNKWEECRTLLLSKRKKIIPKVLLTALEFRDRERMDMENALQEAILGEIPRIERFLSTLGMLAAIAPLLGLLGTVTGMINTFHVITFYGTGDPRMMSGGISEALVTTMLGLSVAIPIMLCHTLLNRRVEMEIGKIEEKAVSFVNMVFKTRNTLREQE